MKNNKLIIGLAAIAIMITLFLLLKPKQSEKKRMKAPMITKSADKGKKDSIEKFIDQYTLEIKV